MTMCNGKLKVNTNVLSFYMFANLMALESQKSLGRIDICMKD